jgi:hypothetical protein
MVTDFPNFDSFESDDIWFRFRHKDAVALRLLGDYDEVYIESNDRDEIERFMEYVYHIAPFDERLFDVVVFDGQSVFERYVNNSSYEYRVYSRQFIESIMESYWASVKFKEKEIIFD